MTEGIALWTKHAGKFHMSMWYVDLAFHLLGTSHDALAREWIAQARALHDSTEERTATAELLRAEARLRVSDGASGIAENLLREALRVGGTQQARLFEIRAASDLARLLLQQDRREEARDLLAPAYAWFAEGFDTPDLKAAKALVDELA